MAWRSGSLSRTLLQTARSAPIRRCTFTTSPRLRPSSPHQSNFLQPPRRLTFTNPRTLGELGCVFQSLMPLHSVVADARLTSYIAVDARACCELSQGIFGLTCEDS